VTRFLDSADRRIGRSNVYLLTTTPAGGGDNRARLGVARRELILEVKQRAIIGQSKKVERYFDSSTPPH
jgi:hypothetical protein